MQTLETKEDPTDGGPDDPEARPGLLLIFAGETPTLVAFPLLGGRLELGRSELARAGHDDERASRKHLAVQFDGQRFRFVDLGSRNGTFVDGQRIASETTSKAPAVVRIGRSIFLPLRDVRPFEGPRCEVTIDDAGRVAGPRLRATWNDVTREAKASASLAIRGESGTGKEIAARLFHGARGPAERPFVTLRAGASLAADALTRALAEAHGGTLFLDDPGELSIGAQGELLVALESPAAPASIVCASPRGLREEVIGKRLREELYFRIGRPELTLPPLRERREEIPMLALRAISTIASAAPGGAPLRAHSQLIEALVQRHWPGNVRELVGELRRAAMTARADGREVVAAGDLDPEAGAPLEAHEDKPKTLANAEPARIDEALRAAGGNVTAAARALGIHRNQLRRWIAKQHVDVASYGAGKP